MHLFTIFIYFMGEHSISPVFPIAFSLGALYYIYRAFNYSNNKTYIDVNSKFLSVKSRPRHFKKDQKFEVDDIDQLYIKYATDGSGYFSIMAIVNGLEGQKHKKLDPTTKKMPPTKGWFVNRLHIVQMALQADIRH